MELENGPIIKNLAKLFESKNIEESKKFLSNENNFQGCKKFIISNNNNYFTFFLPLLLEEKIILLMSENKKIENYVFKNYK
jgi:hypothetical protein